MSVQNTLLVDLYELTMAQSYFVYKRGASATFDLFVRGLPLNRAYLVFAGLESALRYLARLRFTQEDISYLKKQGLFSAPFLEYLGNFRFRGDIWSIPEGQVFFAQEPVLRITASLIETQVLESFLLNTVNVETMLASKAARVTCAACGRGGFDFSLRRTHGLDAALCAARSSFIAGFSGTSNVLAGKLYGIPVAGTMAHSFVMAFKREIDSFLAYGSVFPSKTILLVDTYNTRKGMENAVSVGLYLKEKGYRLLGVRLDSGSIVMLSRLARRMLDKAGLDYVKIFASGNLDEFKIQGILKRGAPVDYFGVGTNMGASIDAPYLDVVYKISEVTDEGGKFLPTMKLSSAKVTYPGRKQIWRVTDRNGRPLRDIVGLEGEKIKGRPLLRKVVDKGRIIYKSPDLKKIRSFALRNVASLPRKYKDTLVNSKYPVVISPGLRRLRHALISQLGKRQ